MATAALLCSAGPGRADEPEAPVRLLPGPRAVDYALRTDCGWDIVTRDSGVRTALPAPTGKHACDSDYDAALSPDEAWLADARGLWSLRARKRVVALPNGWGFAFSEDGRYLAYVDTPPLHDPAFMYAARSRVVLLDLRKGTTRASRRVLGALSNGAPLGFVTSPPAVLVTDYALMSFAIPSLEPRAVSWKDVSTLARERSR